LTGYCFNCLEDPAAVWQGARESKQVHSPIHIICASQDWQWVKLLSVTRLVTTRCLHATEDNLLMQMGIIAGLRTAPRNPAGVHVDGSSARRPDMGF